MINKILNNKNFKNYYKFLIVHNKNFINASIASCNNI